MSNEVFVYKGGKQKVPKDVARVRIDPSVKVIGPIAFKDCHKLKYIEFSEGLQSISSYAFSCCKSLQYVRLPSCTRKIGLGAFENCTSMKNLVLNYGLEHIAQSSFSGCLLLEYLCIPSTVVHMGSYAFVDCSALKEVALNQGLTKIYHGSFQWCVALQTIGVPSTVKSIAEDAIPETATQDRTNASELWRDVYGKVQEMADAYVQEEAEEYAARRCIAATRVSVASDLTLQMDAARSEVEVLRQDQRKSGATTNALLTTSMMECDGLQRELNALRSQVQDFTSKFDLLNGVVGKLQAQLEAVSQQGKETQAGLLQVKKKIMIGEVPAYTRNKARSRGTTAVDDADVQVRQNVIMLTEKMDQVMNMIQSRGHASRSEKQYWKRYSDDDETTEEISVTVRQDMSDSFDDDDDRSFYD